MSRRSASSLRTMMAPVDEPPVSLAQKSLQTGHGPRTQPGIEAQLVAKTRFIDTRTGEAATANTPKEFLKQTEKNLIGEIERKTAKIRADGAFRMPLDYVQDRIDRFASKFAKVVEDILFASIIAAVVNSLESPSLAEKIYPCPAIVPKANASGI